MTQGETDFALRQEGTEPSENGRVEASASLLWDSQAREPHSLSVSARVVAYLGSLLAPKSVFEFGCDEGGHLKLLRERISPPPSVLRGCDTNGESISHGREAFGLDLSEGDVDFLTSLDETSFDLVFTVSALGQMSNGVDVLAELMRIARRHVLLFEPTGVPSNRERLGKETSEGCRTDMREDGVQPTSSNRYRAAAALLGLRTRAHLPAPLEVPRLGPYYEIHLYEKVQDRICLADRIRGLASAQGSALSFPDGRYPDLSRLLAEDAPASEPGGETTVRFVLDTRDADAFEKNQSTAGSPGSVVLCDRSLVDRVCAAADRAVSGLHPIHTEGELVLLTDLSATVPAETVPSDLRGAFDQIRDLRQLTRVYGMSLLDWHEESVEAERKAQSKKHALDRSLKYRIGEAMIRAARPSRDTLLLPARLWELYREAKGKSKAAIQAKRRRRKNLRSADMEIRGLFFATNGVGLGHLTRSLAIARQLREFEPAAEIAFLTTCHATHLVKEMGFPVYHVPAIKDYDGLMTLEEWNKQLRRQLRRLIDNHGARFLVFDGAQPYDGLADVLRSERKALTRVWVKRGQLKATLEEMRQHKMNLFDLVIEPGEVGAAVTDGPTQRVSPITLLGEEDLYTREEAAEHLGLDPTRRAVLLLLGAGNINDTQSLTRQAITVAQKLDAQVVVAESPIAKDHIEAPEGVVVAKEYPISRLFRAFDLAVAAAGYNTVAELCKFQVPSILIPNESTGADDQVARAHAASEAGIIRVLSPFSREGLERQVRELLLSSMDGQYQRLSGVANGAHQAAELIYGAVRTP